MDLQDKVAIVTGAGSGIGRGIALAMAARGARVAAVDLDGKSADETARLLMGAGGKGVGVQADTSRAADVDRAVTAAVSQLGPLDIMVNNAGILDGYFNVDETDEAVWTPRDRDQPDRRLPRLQARARGDAAARGAGASSTWPRWPGSTAPAAARPTSRPSTAWSG